MPLEGIASSFKTLSITSDCIDGLKSINPFKLSPFSSIACAPVLRLLASSFSILSVLTSSSTAALNNSSCRSAGKFSNTSSAILVSLNSAKLSANFGSSVTKIAFACLGSKVSMSRAVPWYITFGLPLSSTIVLLPNHCLNSGLVV